MKKNTLHRRTLLRGIAGTAVALPMLEMMTSGRTRADSDTSPCRLLTTFAGVSLGRDVDFFVPNRQGPDYDLKRALSPLGDECEVSGIPGHQIADRVSVVSGLELPWENGGSVPAGGRERNWHRSQLIPLLTGSRVGSRDTARSATADQIVARHHEGQTPFESLAYRVQPVSYRGANGGGGFVGRMSYSERDDGTIVPRDPIASPRSAYDSLFAGFTSTDPREEAERQFHLSRRQSVLDLVGRRQRAALLGRLGTEDQRRIERHFDHIVDLEERLRSLAPTDGGACEMLMDPGPDPEVGGIGRDGAGTPFIVDQGYSDEETRARVLSDLMYMAFACDLTRTGSILYTMEQCFMMVNRLPGVTHDLDAHAIGHNGSGNLSAKASRMADVLAWHTRHFGYLLRRLEDTPDGPDRTLLDNTVALFMPEGGHGLDPATGNENSPHSSENMAMLVAGGAGGLRPGRHIVAPRDKQHPAHVIISALQAAGIETTSYGEITGGGIDALF